MDRPQTLFLLFSCFFILLLVGSTWLATFLHPAEDAVILFGYSQNLAQDGRISYNPGEAPVEGATDFLWMLLIALGNYLGISPYASSLLLSLLGLLWMIFVFYQWQRDNAVIFLSFCLGLLLAPQWWAALQGFSSYFWGGALISMFYFYYRGNNRLFVLAALFACLIRPEAVIMVIPLALTLIYLSSDRLRLYQTFFSIGLLPGILYFFWRWKYFGLFFPLPFYVKGLQAKWGIFDLDSLHYWGIYLGRYLSPLIIPLVIYWKKLPLKAKILAIVGIFIPALFYSSISLEQNIAHRFAFPVLLSSLTAFALLWKQLKRPWLWMGIYLTLSLLYSFIYLARSLPLHQDQYPSLGKELKNFSGNMALTEAGRLPYYSRWKSLDLWGLNSPKLSRKAPDIHDFQEFQADIILLDDGESSFCELYQQSATPYRREKSWDNMIFNSLKYLVETDSFVLYFIPYQTAQAQNSAWEDFFYSIVPNAYQDRHDLIGLRKTHPNFAEIDSILHKRGGKTFNNPCSPEK